MTELTFLPWSQDGEGPVPADYQPRLFYLHTHDDKRIPGGEDGTNEQRTRADTSSELPAPLRWTQRGGYLRAGSWYLLPRLPQRSCLTLELERRKRAGLCHKHGEGRGREGRGGEGRKEEDPRPGNQPPAVAGTGLMFSSGLLSHFSPSLITASGSRSPVKPNL